MSRFKTENINIIIRILYFYFFPYLFLEQEELLNLHIQSGPFKEKSPVFELDRLKLMVGSEGKIL